MHAGLKLKHACYVAAIKSARLARLMMLKHCLVKMPKKKKKPFSLHFFEK